MEQKAQEATAAKKRKAGAIEDEIAETRKRIKSLGAEAKSCIDKADKKEEEALRKQKINLVTEAVALRRQGKDLKENEIPKLEEKVKSLMQKLVQK